MIIIHANEQENPIKSIEQEKQLKVEDDKFPQIEQEGSERKQNINQKATDGVEQLKVKTKIKISEVCNGCGICSMQYPDYFFETDEGKAQANDEVVKVDDFIAAEIEGLCPVHAILMEKENKSTRQLLAERLEKIKECRVAYPTKEDIPFRREEYLIPIPVASGERRYDYSSESSANSAARSEFNNKMYSQIDVLILKVITEYRIMYIKPYYSKNVEDNSVYQACNKRAEQILANIARILNQEGLDSDLPEAFDIVDCFPNEDTTWKMLNKGELLSDEMVSSIRSEFKSKDYSEISSYEMYWDTDYMERPAGTDFKGRTKYKDKYCYRNMWEAFQELAKDLLDACYYKDDYIMDRAIDLVKGFIVEYNEKLEQSLKGRIDYIEKKLDSIQEDADLSTIAMEVYPKMMRKIVHYKDKPICVNGIETNDKEIFIIDACDGKEQFFYDGKVVKKRFISKGIVKNEVILKDMQPQYDRIIGYDEQILFEHDNCLWRYDCKKDACERFADNIFGIRIYKNILFYTVCDNISQIGKSGDPGVRMNSSGSIWCSSFDGKVKTQLKSFGYGSGLVFIKLVNDENVFYSVSGNKNQEGCIDWIIDTFLPDGIKDDDLYTDFEITEEYKQQKLADK